jgi:hypothetical protein
MEETLGGGGLGLFEGRAFYPGGDVFYWGLRGGRTGALEGTGFCCYIGGLLRVF